MFTTKLMVALALAMAPMAGMALSPKVAAACYTKCVGPIGQRTCFNEAGASGWGVCNTDGVRCYFTAPGCIG